MKQAQKICQSCGMPMKEEQYGRNGDGSLNDKYCLYCLKDGVLGECTLEQMVEICAPIEVKDGRCGTLEEARAALRQYLPTLERWQKAGAKA